MTNDKTNDPIVDRLVAWMKAGRCDLSRVMIKNVAGKGRGIYAAKRLVPNKSIIYIPRDYMMTTVLARASDIGQAMIKSGVDLQSTHSLLAAYMLQEKRNHFSFWQPYLASQPDNFDNVPLFFDEETFRYLKGSTVAERILNRRHAIVTEYNEIAQATPVFRAFSYNEFLWARTALTTRCFGVTIDDCSETAMIPFIDMFNHARHPGTHWGGRLGGLDVTAMDYFSAGDALPISYGEKSTNRFLASYGFLGDDKETDECSITACVDSADTLYHPKCHLVSSSEEFALRYAYDDAFKNCLAYLRFVVQDCLVDEETRPSFMAIDNEVKALQKLIKHAKQSLACYDTSLSDDLAMLKQPFDDDNVRCCVAIRAREKAVLYKVIDFAQEAIVLWQTPNKALRKARLSSNGFISAYFPDVMEA